MNNKRKMYVVVRADMSPGYQIVQSCHAVADHERRFPREGARHNGLGNTMVALQVPDEDDLIRLFRVVGMTTPATIFYEPDVGQFTAFAASPGPDAWRFEGLSLAGTIQEETDEA